MIDRSKDGDKEKTFDGRERLTARCSRVPNADQQMVHCHGYDSNVCRRQRKKANEDGLVPSILHFTAAKQMEQDIALFLSESQTTPQATTQPSFKKTNNDFVC